MFQFKKGDLLAVGAVLLAAVLVFVLFLPRSGDTGAYAQVYQGGKLLLTLPLDEDQQIPVTGDYCNTITVKDGKIAITESDCPGEDCVGIGWIHRPGKSIVCLPNGLEIRVVGSDADVDLVVG